MKHIGVSIRQNEDTLNYSINALRNRAREWGIIPQEITGSSCVQRNR